MIGEYSIAKKPIARSLDNQGSAYKWELKVSFGTLAP